MDVAVIAYRLDEFTARCLEALRPSAWPVTIVDAAPQASTEALAAERGVAYVSAGKRLGYAAACNLACRKAFTWDVDEVLILNNDTWDFRGLDRLEQAVDRHRGEYGVFFGIQRPLRLYRPHPSWFSGFVLTKGCYDQVGPFDEGYEIANFEDDDYLMRLAEAGVRTALVRGFSFEHYVGASLGLQDPERVAAFQRNAARFRQKWGIPRVDKESPGFTLPGMVEIFEHSVFDPEHDSPT